MFYRDLGLGILAAVLVKLGFAPFAFYYAPIFGLALFAFLIKDVGPKQGFLLGFTFGLVLYLLGVSWVYVSLQQYGNMPVWMASVSVLGFCALLASLIGLMTFSLCFLKQGSYRLLVLPFIWVIFEWVKSWLFTGFPWLDIGYTQVDSVFSGWAPIGGVYLVSFVLLSISSLLIYGFLERAASRYKAACALLVLIAASIALKTIDWSLSKSDPIEVTVVQGNIDIQKKWRPNYRYKVLEIYSELSAQSQQQGDSDLIVWPETAVPYFYDQTQNDFWSRMVPALQTRSALLTGLLDRDDQGNHYNSAVLHCGLSGQNQTAVYRKRHLVPFGEYLPFKALFAWVFDYLNLPMSGFTSWQGEQQLQCPQGLNIGLSICYEDAFANEHRVNVPGSNILVNISEDAWFGDSFAPHQRVQMARMRAMELAKPLVRSANTGPSMFVSASGKLLGATQQFKADYLTAELQPSEAVTPFARFGNWIIYLSLLVLVFVSIATFTKARK